MLEQAILKYPVGTKFICKHFHQIYTVIGEKFWESSSGICAPVEEKGGSGGYVMNQHGEWAEIINRVSKINDTYEIY